MSPNLTVLHCIVIKRLQRCLGEKWGALYNNLALQKPAKDIGFNPDMTQRLMEEMVRSKLLALICDGKTYRFELLDGSTS